MVFLFPKLTSPTCRVLLAAVVVAAEPAATALRLSVLVVPVAVAEHLVPAVAAVPRMAGQMTNGAR